MAQAARRASHLQAAGIDAPVDVGLRAPAWAISIAVLGGAAYLLLFVSALLSANANLLQALAVAPVLVMLTVPIALRIARLERDRGLATLVMVAVVAKLLAALVRYYVAFVVYSGASDAAQYNESGKEFAPSIRSLAFDIDVGKVVGTGFMRIVTAFVYAIFGASKIGGFLVFAWIGFLGLLLFWRAFRIGVPQGDSRRYLILVLFLPSLLYWPSAIGKEAWMTLALGACAYGVACLFQRRGHGLVVLALGMWGVLMVRPHVAMVVFVGLVFALLLRRTPAHSYFAPLMRVLGLGVLIVVGLFLAGRTASFLGTDSLSQESVSEELTDTESQTAEGGSAFSPVRVNTPIDFPPAFVTVFFRPFPNETGSMQGLLTAGEGLLLFALLAASWRRLRNVPSLMRSTPYVAFSVGYVLAFVYAFSSFSNFGILARQRVQALPLLLVVLAVPPFSRALTPEDGEPAPTSSDRSPQ